MILISTAEANQGICGQCNRGMTPEKREELAAFKEILQNPELNDDQLTTPDNHLEYFGFFLVKLLRDRMLELLGDSETIREGIDETIHDFLAALEGESYPEGRIKLLVDGIDIASQSDGLAGELFGETGWLKRYSNFSS